MKRYDLEDTASRMSYQTAYEMVERDDGGWVRFDDVNELLSKDSGRTREHNILVEENRELRATLAPLIEALRRIEKIAEVADMAGGLASPKHHRLHEPATIARAALEKAQVKS